MKINKIHITRFGKLENYTLDFEEGCNIIYGNNEDGKSTIMAFIKMMFYGSTGKSGDLAKNIRKKYMPWDGSKMAGFIEFDDKGIQYRIERTFGATNATDKINLWNIAKGEKEQIASGIDIGQRFFGIGAAAFEKSVFIGQVGSMTDLGTDKDDEITQRLLNLVSTGDETVSQKKVEGRLQSAKEELKSKSGRIGSLDKQYQEQSALIEARLTAREEENKKKQMERQCAILEEQKEALEKTHAQYQQQIDIAEKLNLLGKLENLLQNKQGMDKLLNDLDEKKQQLVVGGIGFGADFIKSCETQMQNIRSFENVLADRNGKLQEILNDIKLHNQGLIVDFESEKLAAASIKNQYETKKQELDTAIKLQESANVEHQLALNEIKSKELLANQKIESAKELIKSMSAEKQVTGNAKAGLKVNGSLLIITAAIFVLSVIFGVTVHVFSFFGVVLAVCLGIVAFIIPKTKQTTDIKEDSVISHAGINLDDIMQTAKREIDAAHENEKNAGIRLEELTVKTAQLQNETSEYNRLYREAQEKLSRMEFLNETLIKAQEEIKQAKENVQQLTQQFIEFVSRYKRVETFEAGVLIVQDIKALCEEIKTLEVKIQSQSELSIDDMRDKSSDELEKEAIKLREQITGMVEALPLEKRNETQVEQLKVQLKGAFQQLQQVREDLVKLNSNITSEFSNKKNVSQIDEELWQLEQSINERESYYKCLDIAQTTLLEAFTEIRQSFGPLLNDKTASIFNRLTDGKYHNVIISRNFDINVQDMISGVSHEWQYLSSGTIDQAYLALRLAVAEMLAEGSSGLPLLLDDVFIQYDDNRAEQGLRFLLNFAKKNPAPTQIILFTCHKSMIDLARKHNADVVIKSI